jgi:hypothetical protein
MHRALLGVTCVCAIVACSDDTALSIGTADLAFEGSGTETVAWAIAHPGAGWSLYFSSEGSAETSCNDESAPFDTEVDLWVGGSASEALPTGEYHVTYADCGSGALCSSMTVGSDVVEWAEIELIDSTAEDLRGSLMGSAFVGSGAEMTFYGSFDAEACN